MDESTPEIKKRFKELPPVIQQIILKSNWKEQIKTIAEKYKLRIDQGAALETETFLVMLGFEGPEDFYRNLTQEVRLNKEQAKLIAHEIEDRIFLKIRHGLIDATEEEAEETLVPQNIDGVSGGGLSGNKADGFVRVPEKKNISVSTEPQDIQLSTNKDVQMPSKRASKTSSPIPFHEDFKPKESTAPTPPQKRPNVVKASDILKKMKESRIEEEVETNQPKINKSGDVEIPKFKGEIHTHNETESHVSFHSSKLTPPTPKITQGEPKLSLHSTQLENRFDQQKNKEAGSQKQEQVPAVQKPLSHTVTKKPNLIARATNHLVNKRIGEENVTKKAPVTVKTSHFKPINKERTRSHPKNHISGSVRNRLHFQKNQDTTKNPVVTKKTATTTPLSTKPVVSNPAVVSQAPKKPAGVATPTLKQAAPKAATFTSKPLVHTKTNYPPKATIKAPSVAKTPTPTQTQQKTPEPLTKPVLPKPLVSKNTPITKTQNLTANQKPTIAPKFEMVKPNPTTQQQITPPVPEPTEKAVVKQEKKKRSWWPFGSKKKIKKQEEIKKETKELNKKNLTKPSKKKGGFFTKTNKVHLKQRSHEDGNKEKQDLKQDPATVFTPQIAKPVSTRSHKARNKITNNTKNSKQMDLKVEKEFKHINKVAVFEHNHPHTKKEHLVRMEKSVLVPQLHNVHIHTQKKSDLASGEVVVKHKDLGIENDILAHVHKQNKGVVKLTKNQRTDSLEKLPKISTMKKVSEESLVKKPKKEKNKKKVEEKVVFLPKKKKVSLLPEHTQTKVQSKQPGAKFSNNKTNEATRSIQKQKKESLVPKRQLMQIENIPHKSKTAEIKKEETKEVVKKTKKQGVFSQLLDIIFHSNQKQKHKEVEEKKRNDIEKNITETEKVAKVTILNTPKNENITELNKRKDQPDKVKSHNKPFEKEKEDAKKQLALPKTKKKKLLPEHTQTKKPQKEEAKRDRKKTDWKQKKSHQKPQQEKEPIAPTNNVRTLEETQTLTEKTTKKEKFTKIKKPKEQSQVEKTPNQQKSLVPKKMNGATEKETSLQSKTLKEVFGTAKKDSKPAKKEEQELKEKKSISKDKGFDSKKKNISKVFENKKTAKQQATENTKKKSKLSEVFKHPKPHIVLPKKIDTYTPKKDSKKDTDQTNLKKKQKRSQNLTKKTSSEKPETQERHQKKFSLFKIFNKKKSNHKNKPEKDVGVKKDVNLATIEKQATKKKEAIVIDNIIDQKLNQFVSMPKEAISFDKENSQKPKK